MQSAVGKTSEFDHLMRFWQIAFFVKGLRRLYDIVMHTSLSHRLKKNVQNPATTNSFWIWLVRNDQPETNRNTYNNMRFGNKKLVHFTENEMPE